MRPARKLSMRLPLCLCLLPLVAGLGGCATRSYVSDAPSNLTVRADIESSFLRKSGAKLDILAYKEGGKCETEYLGSLELGAEPVQAGLQTGRKTALRFVLGLHGNGNVFNHDRVFTTVKWIGVLTPRPGAQYVAKVRYDGEMYEVRVQELNSRGAVVREVERQQAECAAE